MHGLPTSLASAAAICAVFLPTFSHAQPDPLAWCDGHPSVCLGLLHPSLGGQGITHASDAPCLDTQTFHCTVLDSTTGACPAGYVQCPAHTTAPTSSAPTRAPTPLPMCNGQPVFGGAAELLRCSPQQPELEILSVDTTDLGTTGKLRVRFSIATGTLQVSNAEGLYLVFVVVEVATGRSVPIDHTASNVAPTDAVYAWTQPRGDPADRVYNTVLTADVVLRNPSTLFASLGEHKVRARIALTGVARPYRNAVARSNVVSFTPHTHGPTAAPSAAPTAAPSLTAMCDGIVAATCATSAASLSVIEVDASHFVETQKVRVVMEFATGAHYVDFDEGLKFVFVVKGDGPSGYGNVGINHVASNAVPPVPYSGRGMLGVLSSYTGPLADAVPALEGIATLYVDEGSGTTTVTVQVSGLAPSSTYPVHLHAEPCSAGGGGHYLNPSCAATFAALEDGTVSRQIMADIAAAAGPTVTADVAGKGIAAMFLSQLNRASADLLTLRDPSAAVLITAFVEAGWEVVSMPLLAVRVVEALTLYRTLDNNPSTECGTIDRCVATASAFFAEESELAYLGPAFSAAAAALESAGVRTMFTDEAVTRCTVNDVNELWPELATGADGAGVSTARVNWLPATADMPALSIVVHDTVANGKSKMLCADLRLPYNWTEPRGRPATKALSATVTADVTFYNPQQRFDFLGEHRLVVHLARGNDPTPYRNRLASSSASLFRLETASPTQSPTTSSPTTAPTVAASFQCVTQLDSFWLGSASTAVCEHDAALLEPYLADCTDKESPLWSLSGPPAADSPSCAAVFDGRAAIGGFTTECTPALAERVNMVARKFGGPTSAASCNPGAAPYITFFDADSCDATAAALNAALQSNNPSGFCNGPEVRFSSMLSDRVVYTNGLRPENDFTLFATVLYDTRDFVGGEVHLEATIANRPLLDAGYVLPPIMSVSRLVTGCAEFDGTDSTGFSPMLTNLPRSVAATGSPYCTATLMIRMSPLTPRHDDYTLNVRILDTATGELLTTTLVAHSWSLSYAEGPGAAAGDVVVNSGTAASGGGLGASASASASGAVIVGVLAAVLLVVGAAGFVLRRRSLRLEAHPASTGVALVDTVAAAAPATEI